MIEWTTACPDWERRIVMKGGLIPFKPLFPEYAEKAMRIFRELVVVDVAGSPRMGDVCREWFLEFVAAIFGAYDEETGRRMIKEAFLLISKKNMKSTGAAGIMMTALTLNWRESAEFFILAPTVEVANNSFYPARDMVRADPELDALYHVQDHVKTITHRVTGASLKVVAADASTVSGKKGSITLIDEMWLFGKMANAADMLREATGGLASRPEGMTIYLSTQSNEAPAGVFRSKLQYARGVRDGRIKDPQFLPVLYEFPESMLNDKSYLEPKNFYITNPNLGASVDTEYLEREARIAQESSDSEALPGFLAKHLNVEIGLSLRSDGWAGAEYWKACGTNGLTLDEVIRRCDVISVGIDGGGLDDLLGLAVLGREKVTGNWLHFGRAWAHQIAIERRKSNASKYSDFKARGDLVIVERPGDDVTEVCEIIQRVYKSGKLDKIGVDPAGIGAVLDCLDEYGIPQELIVGISQGWRMNGAIKTLERKLSGGQFFHQDSELMAWAVSNAKVEPKGNALTITKQVSGAGKIDPLMALINATELMSRAKPQKQFQMFVL